MAGKKLLRYTRMFIDEFNISGDSRNFSSLDAAYAEVEMTGWSNQVKNFLADGMMSAGIRGYQAFINDAANGAYTALIGGGSHIASMLFGTGAEPAIGDAAYMMSGVEFSDVASFDGGAGILSADFLPSSNDTGRPFGLVLHPETSITTTTTAASVNNGAASANGYHVNLHITASSGGEWSFKVEHSANGSSWADLCTFTIDGSAISSESLSGTGTVNQYIRFVATRTSGTVTPVCAFARN